MKQFDVVSNWLNSVSYAHSQTKATEEQYKRVWKRFAGYIGKTAIQVLPLLCTLMSSELRFTSSPRVQVGLEKNDCGGSQVILDLGKTDLKRNFTPSGCVFTI